MCEMVQKLVNTPLFSFQILKLSTKKIIAILRDTLNTTSSPLPILDPHATKVLSNTLERHSIGSCVEDGIHNLVTNSNMAKLVGFPTSDFTFTYQKGTENISLMDLVLNKGVLTHLSTNSLTHFRRWCLVKKLPSPPELPLSTILNQQSRWEDIHPE
jgi:hypothetical protein